MNRDNRVTAIVVTHNSDAVIGDMLRSLPDDLPLIVVDNASRDNTLDIIEGLRRDAVIYKNPIGLGYGNGMNVALKTLTTEFALLINPDTIIEPDTIKQLQETADQYPEAGLFGPKVLNPDGSVEISYDVEIHKRTRFGRRDDSIIPEGPLCADSLSGAVIFARMTCLRDINYFDREYFLYFEDEDMCMQARRAGYSLVFDPRAALTHVGGGSIPATPGYHWEKFWHMSWSRLYYENKFKGRLSMWGVFIMNAPKFAFKTLAYGLIFKWQKARRDAARCMGMIAYVIGIRASRVPKS